MQATFRFEQKLTYLYQIFGYKSKQLQAWNWTLNLFEFISYLHHLIIVFFDDIEKYNLTAQEIWGNHNFSHFFLCFLGMS